MAPDATVLVALRRQSSFPHRSLDGGGLLGWSGGAAFFAAFGTCDVTRWCTLHFKFRDRARRDQGTEVRAYKAHPQQLGHWTAPQAQEGPTPRPRCRQSEAD
eukprot:1748256-Prymnesium_polylepis.1